MLALHREHTFSDLFVDDAYQLRVARPFPATYWARWRLHLLEPRLVESYATVIIPFDNRVLFVRLLHCAEFSSRLSEVPQPLDTISGIQFLVSGRGSASGGFWARSASGVAPGYDRGGWGALRSLGIGLLMTWLIFYCLFPEARVAPFTAATCSSPRSKQHRLRKSGSDGPNCTVLRQLVLLNRRARGSTAARSAGLHDKHGYARGEHCHCGDRHDGPSQG
jgi:hypothetical protein